jgi:hypothetical protein
MLKREINFREADFKVNRAILYAEQEKNRITIIAICFITLVLILKIDRLLTDVPNPFGLPGGLSQYVIFSFGFLFLFAVKQKESLKISWSQTAGLLWVCGLFLASISAESPRTAIAQAISISFYFLAGYGVFKASLDDRVLKQTALITGLIGIGWSLVIIYVFLKNGGKLPIEYIAFLGRKGTFNHHAYGLLIMNGAVSMLALFSKRKGVFWAILIPFMIAGAIFAVIVSQARACFLGLIITTSYILIRNENIKGRGAAILRYGWIIITLLVIVWTFRQGAERYEDVYQRFDFRDREYQKQKSWGRIEMLKKGIILISTHPFGVGGGNARLTNVQQIELMRIEGYVLHNQFLTTISEGGWIMFVVWFIIIKETIVVPLKFRWSKPERLAVYACWLNCNILGFFADILGNYFFIMLYLVSAAITLERHSENK